MVRTVLALLALSLLAPVFSADTAAAPFSAEQGCRAAGIPADLPDCRVSHAGTATLVSCDETSCVLSIQAGAEAAGLLPGQQAVETAIVADVRTVVCGAVAVSPFPGDVACEGDVQVTVAVPGACRLLVVATTATADRVVSSSAYSELRVCRDGNVTTP
ncbi:MAG TPA: hypothetical protein VNX21_06435 [Candidatus Thermoplasmatota archaeon]|nr:hypothetical protein [Candidatus Thermoplasmatota archaeon]